MEWNWDASLWLANVVFVQRTRYHDQKDGLVPSLNAFLDPLAGVVELVQSWRPQLNLWYSIRLSVTMPTDSELFFGCQYRCKFDLLA